jgi:hypothetical protein
MKVGILLLAVMVTLDKEVKTVEDGNLVDIELSNYISRKTYMRQMGMLADNILEHKKD